MSYRPTKETEQWEAPPGLGPWREITDEEYARLEAAYDGDLSRWYERIPDRSASGTSESRPPRARARKEE